MSSVLADVLRTPSPVEQMVWILRLRILIPAISVAARLGVADQIGEEPRDAEDIAHAISAHPQSLHRLLRCLASAGVFEQVTPGRFAHSALSRTLASGGSGSLREFAMMYTSEWLVRALDGLEYSLRTGEGCLSRALGKTGYEWIAERPEEAALVNRAMAEYSQTMETGVIDTLDLSWAKRIVDVGGGDGTFLARILGKYPTASGVVAELAHVADGARQLIAARGLTERCEVAAIDMFAGVPGGADAYVLKRVLHNWNAEKSVTILRHCRAALRPGGRILIIDSMIPGSGRALFSSLGDLQGLGLGGASERTEEEFREICSAASLMVSRIDYPSEFTAIMHAKAA